MKHILFITTGGTIASVQTDRGLAPLMSSAELLNNVPELQELCQVEALPLFNLDSTDMTPHEWLAIAAAIEEHYDAFDGFVICHGTDTLAYTAAALSYLVRNADKPIVLTGAQKPICNQITDAKKNLRDSVLCAIDPQSRGVMIVFDGKVIAGTRGKKVKTYSYDAFASVNFPTLALVQNDRLVRYIPSPLPTGPVEFCHTLNPKVFLLKLTPGVQPEILREVFRLYDCVVVESFGVGGIPAGLTQTIREVMAQYAPGEKLVVMATQVTYEGSNVGVYEVGARLKDAMPLLEAHDMTLEAVCTKMMWVLGRSSERRSFAQIERDFYSPINFDTTYTRR